MKNYKQIAKQNNQNKRHFFNLYANRNIFKSQNTSLAIDDYQSMKNKPILYVKNLYKKYPHKKKPTINNISFNVYPGQFHAFVGANGAGKTTTIKCLIGAYARWSGSILINGKKNTSIAAKKDLGYIPENARFPAKMNTFSYLVWMARLSGLKHANAKIFAVRKLNELNMWKLRRRNPNTFSSGQKKKILLAQATINDPSILIMDEPAANLDPKARLDLYMTLNKLAQQGKAIFISSHVLAELDKYANAVTILDGGKIIFNGTIKELYDKYADRKIQILASNMTKLKTILNQMNISYEWNLSNDKIVVSYTSVKQENDFLYKIIKDKNIQLLSYEEIGNKLDDIYAKLIKYGSVDTMDKKDV